MMELDQEMKDDFVKEVKQLQMELQDLVNQLSDNWTQSALFERFGQTIDRIYGTATTLGFAEFGQYAKALKDVCYMCRHTEQEIAQKKVVNMMSGCLENFDALCLGVYDKKELLKVSTSLKVAIKKLDTLERSYFVNFKDKKSIPIR